MSSESSPPIDLGEQYRRGERRFEGLVLSGGDSVRGGLWEACVFTKCTFVGNFQHWAPGRSRFDSCEFEATNLTTSNFEGGHLIDCVFRSCNLHHAHWFQATVDRCHFSNCDLQDAHLGKAVLIGTRFRNETTFARTTLAGATFKDVSFELADGYGLRSCNLSHSELGTLSLRGRDLRNCDLSGASAMSAELRETLLHGVNLSNAKIAGVDLRGIGVDHQTRFDGAEVFATRIDHFALEALSNYGGLTRGQMMQMRIDNGLAELRAAYSGFWQWLHIAALFIFLFPYAIETGRAYLDSRAGCPAGPCETILSHLATFIYTGGRPGYGLAIASFGPFVYGLLYNTLRGVLLWKTKSLELRQEASGLPVSFGLQRRITGRLPVTWEMLVRAASIGFWVNVTLVMLHTFHFLSRTVPLP